MTWFSFPQELFAWCECYVAGNVRTRKRAWPSYVRWVFLVCCLAQPANPVIDIFCMLFFILLFSFFESCVYLLEQKMFLVLFFTFDVWWGVLPHPTNKPSDLIFSVCFFFLKLCVLYLIEQKHNAVLGIIFSLFIILKHLNWLPTLSYCHVPGTVQ